jgi:hypothetical protein
MMYLSRM